MAEATAARTRFQMTGTRDALLDNPVEAIDQQIRAIENALENVPDFAFDLSKVLVESVCKTVLGDIGQPADANWDAPRLLKETTNHLSLLPRNHPDPAKAREPVIKTMRGLLQTIQGLCELRNKYGMASHGRDGFAARLDLRQATLAAQAADTIVAFLYRIHHDALAQSPGARVYYEDHADFNTAFDDANDAIRIGELKLSPSRVLFDADRKAYKEAVDGYVAERNSADETNDSADLQDGAEETTA